jgi:hypothetical protein
VPIGNLVACWQTSAIDPAAPDTERSQWIAVALRRVTDRFPDLEPLVRVLDGSTDLTPEFLVGYFASPVLLSRTSGCSDAPRTPRSRGRFASRWPACATPLAT